VVEHVSDGAAQGRGDIDHHQQRPGRVESALTQGRQHSSHRTLARPSRSRAAVNTPNKCSTAFSPISASISTAFLACVSQFTDSQVSTASFCKYERSLAADSAGARGVRQQLGPVLGVGLFGPLGALGHQLVSGGLAEERDQALPHPHADRLKGLLPGEVQVRRQESSDGALDNDRA
jgi:hypothetical protein